ncbi:hypothetical protein HD806DRAFT_542794 [Xylariaceae sp. AK1471]|nr:hypothetical protein HD806DRAFT_542794 [Xylariaceae sp. AK1471]
MDPFTVLQIVGEAIGLATTLSNVLYFIGAVRDAPAEIHKTKDDVSSLLTLLQCVRVLIEGEGGSTAYFTPLVEPNGPFLAAIHAVKDLLELLGGNLANQKPREEFRVMMLTFRKLTLEDAKWPWKQRKIGELLQRLDSQKASINVALNTAIMNILADVKGRTEQIQRDIKAVNEQLSVMEQKKILGHCLPTAGDIASIHKDRKAQRESQTCGWVTHEVTFKNSLEPRRPHSRPRIICVHGIPGAGKTVLASHLVEIVATSCNRDQDETIPLLRWVVRMLCKQAGNKILPKLKDAYEREDALSLEDLLDCLEAISHEYEKGVYIVVDAVDESKPRERLVNVLSEIGTAERFWKVSLLFTSREENEIMEPIRQLGTSCAFVSMSNHNVREDIKRYVHSQLTTLPVFARWGDEAVLEEVESILTQKAKGMFRWAVCQLDVLKRLRGREAIRQALETLPDDIFATYERILKEIPAPEQVFAKTALALLCSDTAQIPTAEILVTACLHGVPFRDIGRFTVDTLKDICGSLISLVGLNKTPQSHFPRNNEEHSRFHRCNLAHYTVKEYLFSSNAANGPAKVFALSNQAIQNIDLKVIFTGLSHFGIHRQNHPQKVSRYEEYCLQMTEHSLLQRRADIIQDKDLRDTLVADLRLCTEIVLRSLTPFSPHLAHLNQQHGITLIIRTYFPEWAKLSWAWDSAPPAMKGTGLLVNLALLNWQDLADKYLESHAFKDLSRAEKNRIWTEDFKLRNQARETVLGYCLRERQVNFVRLFIRHGASFDQEPEALYTAIRAFEDKDKTGNKTLGALVMLLNAGASTNPTPGNSIGRVVKGFAFTPLQLAVYKLEYEWVELLLDEGADVNNIGKLDGIIPSSFDDPDKQSDDLKALKDMGQQTPLEICAYTQPSWTKKDKSDAVKNVRRSIEELLKRYGAEESVEDVDEEMTEDDPTPTGDVDRPEMIDLTIASDNGHGH